MNEQPSQDLLETVLAAAGESERVIVAIAGPPGAGKSTLSSGLDRQLKSAGESASVVPMDGFHLDNETLDRMGLRHRKGAPETFDAIGFVDLVQKLKRNTGDVSVPQFDRANDRVRGDGVVVKRNCRFVLVEGNYLLLEEEPWHRLEPFFDLTVFLSAPIAELRERLVARWLDLGYERAAAEEKAGGNDIPNAERVLSNSRAADVVVQSTDFPVHSP
ncbi:nucleoside triphosphate hydrolase [Hoeflea sp.]|uniref:nucleoside triphosphate hydrolase n=1 Tax=Hoeflea sp. TaxID=1940281 RepID=UPI003B0137C4